MNCGWKESVHIFRGKNVSSEDQEKLDQVRSGRRYSFRECPEYLLSCGEKISIDTQERQLTLC